MFFSCLAGGNALKFDFAWREESTLRSSTSLIFVCRRYTLSLFLATISVDSASYMTEKWYVKVEARTDAFYDLMTILNLIVDALVSDVELVLKMVVATMLTEIIKTFVLSVFEVVRLLLGTFLSIISCCGTVVWKGSGNITFSIEIRKIETISG